MLDYQKFKKQQQNIHLVSSISSVLEWDQQCMMPAQASEYRGEQLAWLAGTAHNKLLDPEYSQLLKAAEKDCEKLADDDFRKIHIKKSKRSFARQKLLPSSLIEATSRAASKGQAAWEKARKEKDFKIFAPALKEQIDLAKEKAALMPEDKPYDALLTEFDWGLTSAKLSTLFKDLKNFLPPFIEKVKERQGEAAKLDNTVFDVNAQEKIGLTLAEELGFNAEKSLLTTSTHPFSITLGKQDFRITTRYDKHDFISSFLGIAHEMGHSLYEQGLPQEYFGTTLGAACSFGIHESQSLFWEKRIVSSPVFLKKWFPKFKNSFNSPLLDKLSPEEFYTMINKVQASLVRVDADEVSYCLHIIIRFEIEQALFDGSLNAEDIPSAWNEKYQTYLGIQAQDDLQGCLQDVHWAFGAFGYFPSYALGHLFSAQLAASYEENNPSLDSAIEQSDYQSIRAWLGENVHKKGSSLDPLELIKDISGNELSSQYFCDYLTKKYLSH